jgi:hypothetical protein
MLCSSSKAGQEAPVSKVGFESASKQFPSRLDPAKWLEEIAQVDNDCRISKVQLRHAGLAGTRHKSSKYAGVEKKG